MATRHASSKFSGVFDSSPPDVRTKRSSLKLDQPVYCTSAIRSQRSSSLWNTDRFAMSGNSMSALTPPLVNVLLTPAASRPTTGASAGGSVGSDGLSKLTFAATLYLIVERYEAPKRVCGVTSHSTPMFQPQALSSPFTCAFDSSPGVRPTIVGTSAGGISPAPAAWPAACASPAL